MPTPSFKGQKDLQSQSSDYNARTFHIRQELSKLSTSTLVRVESVNVEGRISPVGYVDVKPLVDQMDGQGNPVEHGIIYNVPYVRIQGGANAFIIDPQVGDIGMCNFADRDISRVKENKAPSLPGSKRLMSMADGLYTGGLLNGTPERYIIIDDDGIEVEGAALVHVHAESVTVDCTTMAATVAESLTVDCDTAAITGATSITATAPSIVLDGDVTGPGSTPPTFSKGIDVNGKIVDDVHMHLPGAYNIGGTPVTGNSGGLP